MTLLRKAAFVLMVLAAPSTLANPTGGTVTSGAATIQQNGSTLQVTTSTQNTTINWQNFSIGAGETTNFTQPSSSSVVVNQVTTQNLSQIFGSLTSNGQVVLINPNGVLLGPSAQVNTTGFTVDTGPGVLTLDTGVTLSGGVGPVTLLITSTGGVNSISVNTVQTVSGSVVLSGTVTTSTTGGTSVNFAASSPGSGGAASIVAAAGGSPTTVPPGAVNQQSDHGGSPAVAGVAVNLQKREPLY